jgi:hypothetical protein
MTVNPIFIDKFLAPLIGGADIDEDLEEFGGCNPDIEQQVRRLALDVLLPEFNKQIPPIKEAMKNSLAYYLFYGKVNFRSIFDSLLIPFETPKDCRLFFLWIWESFFGNETLTYIKDSDVIEEFNADAAKTLILNYKK